MRLFGRAEGLHDEGVCMCKSTLFGLSCNLKDPGDVLIQLLSDTRFSWISYKKLYFKT